MKKTYSASSRAWYMKDGTNREILTKQGILNYLLVSVELEDENETSYEFRIDLHNLGEGAVKIGLFEDSWRSFKDLPNFFNGLVALDRTAPTLEEIEKLLKKLKFKDVTKRRSTFKV